MSFDPASVLDPDALLEEARQEPPARAAVRPQYNLSKVRYTHEDCIDRILADPSISQNELAALYGYSPGWMSIAINTDAFQARLAGRRQELIDPVLRATVEEHFRAITIRSLTVLAEKLAQPAHQVSDRLVIDAAALGAKSLGLGGHAVPPPAPPSDHLHRLASRLVELQAGIRRTGDVVDVTSREVSTG